MVRKTFLLTMIVALMAGLGGAIGCASPLGIAAIDLVPQQANLIGGININRILADQDVKAALDVALRGNAGIYEQYTENEDDQWRFHGKTWLAQSFTPATAHEIERVVLRIWRVGDPGDLVVGIRATDGDGHPAGEDLASGRLSQDEVSPERWMWQEIDVTPYPLSAGTKYAIVVRAPDANGISHYRWKYDHYEGQYPGGSNEYSGNWGESWTTHPGDFLFKEGEKLTLDQALEWMEDEIGIDLRDFSEAVIFGNTELENYFGAILKGAFDKEALIEGIEGVAGEELTITEYKGYQIYTTTIDAEKGAICFLGGDTILCGLVGAVRDAIDVKEGAPHLSGPIYEAYNALGDAWIKVVAAVPETAMGEIPEDVSIGLEAFSDVEMLALSLNKAGEAVSLQLKLLFSSSEGAADAEDTISGLLSFISILPDIPPELIDMIDGLDVSVSGSWVTISFQTTLAEGQELVQALAEMGGEE